RQSRRARTATGPAVEYQYGILSVRVTVSGRRILGVGIASINDGDNARSQSIDHQAIPLLEQEVMQVQSAHIQGVSGASYTSAGFVQSLQSALHTLGDA
ncbi:MAG: FMN-binding protein, partial [Streptosporangiaceae bacterium]